MRKLGQTISTLARYRRHWSALLSSANAAKSTAASAASDHLTETTDFGANPGALRMLTYRPKNLGRSPALVVVLHGCTQSAASYDLGAGWSTLAERHGFVLLLPEQRTTNNPKTCFNWFLPAHTARACGEAQSIREMIEKAIGAHGIDRRRVFITGLSAGGAMAAAMLAVYPEVFAAGAIVAGLPYGTAGNVQQAFESMFQGRQRSPREWGELVRRASSHRGPWPRVSVWHGDRDVTVKPINAEALVDQWRDVHGITSAPIEDKVDGYPRKTWRRHGVDLIEAYSITGMAHGVPLATRARDGGCGTAGPFLLDVGISSSWHIASFFGLTDSMTMRGSTTEAAADPAAIDIAPFAAGERVEFIPDDRVEILDRNDRDEARHEETPRIGPVDVMSIITKALTSAGLMKPPV